MCYLPRYFGGTNPAPTLLGGFGASGMGNNPALTSNPLMMQLLQQITRNAATASPSTLKKSRELYVGNLLIGSVTNAQLIEFFNTAMEAAFGVDSGGFKPVLGAEIHATGTFGFVEFRTAQLATSALQLSGINMMGRELRLARPSGYVPSAADGAPTAEPTGLFSYAVSTGGAATGTVAVVPVESDIQLKARKLFVGNLPLAEDVTEA
eukprot:SAG11_NODE_1311_length_5234_cov_4.354820_3_plen_208_part_00